MHPAAPLLVRARRHTLSRWYLSASLCLVACGGDGSSVQKEAPAATPKVPLASCNGFAEASCANIARCDAPAFGLAYGTQPTCVALRAHECRQATSGPGVIVTDAHVEACTAALSGACGDAKDACTWPRGTLGAGAPCTANLGCLSGVCGVGEELACSTCTSPEKGAAGQACSLLSGPTCADTLFCPRGLGALCTPRAGLGEGCEADGCVSGLGCNNHTCAPLGKSGSPCTDLDNCAEGVCDVNGSKTCVVLKAQGAGEPCSTDITKQCAGGLTCNYGAGATCVSAGTPGGACGSGLEPCFGGFICKNGVCTEPPLPTCAK